MAEVEDKRIRRTKKLLRQALTRLMQQKDFQSITVTDVVREADINRGTFYAHYRDVYDLRDKIETGMIEDFRGMIAAIRPSETVTLKLVLSRLMDYLEENREIVTALIKCQCGADGFGKKMIGVIEECRMESAAVPQCRGCVCCTLSCDRRHRHDRKVDHRVAAHPEDRDGQPDH